MSKAYVLLSGGIDSSTCLTIAARDYNHSVTGVSFDYGQRHTKELDCAYDVCVALEVQHVIKDVAGMIGVGGLTDKNFVVPDMSYSDMAPGVSPTYVPFRNGVMLSLITSLAATDPEAEAIFFGAHADDAANWAYPDCTPEFIGGMANAIYIGTYHKIRLFTPLMFLDKAGVIRLGEAHDTPWKLTWSCYKGEEFHCGTCPTCISRREGFELACVNDPTVYNMRDTA